MGPSQTFTNASEIAPGAFLTTRWSRVVRAGDLTKADAHEALSGLCRDYWRPLYHFARRKGRSPEDAQDATQGFILFLLEGNRLAAADQDRGKFRTFLLKSFTNYLHNEHRALSAQKRGGGVVAISLEDDGESTFSTLQDSGRTPEEEYEHAWALALLERALNALREEYSRAGRELLLEVLEPHLSKAAARPGYASMAQELGMSENAVTVAMHRMRKRYGELIREQIAETVTHAGEVDAELRHLMRVLTGTGNQS